VKIVEIRGYHLACRLPEPQGNANGWYDRRSSLVLELVSHAGLSGWGETWHSPLAAAGVIRESLAPCVLGADPRRPRALAAAMASQRQYDRGGISVMAASAIEMATWDLTARAQGCPVAALLGGALRERVPVYAAGPYFKPGGDPYRNYAHEAEQYARAGFRALKAKIGRGPALDAAAVAAMRQATGPDFALMVDANQGCSARSAIEIARRLAEYDVVWFEEPVPPEDLAGYRRFADAGLIALAGGEALGELGAFRDLIAAGIEVVEPDLAICGGYGAALRVATLAEAAGIAIAPHVWGTGINLHATLQLLAVLPAMPNTSGRNFPWLELDRSPSPLRTFWGEPEPSQDGTVAIPDGPGIGIDIKPADFSQYVVDTWSIKE
jgi:D-galactarolactone cycloisomerase